MHNVIVIRRDNKLKEGVDMSFPFENNEEKFYYKELTVAEWRNKYEQKTDHMPVGQRLPVDYTTTKAENIIISIWEGGGAGMVTLCEIDDDKYEYESIDGGHRKRAIRDYLNNEFPIYGYYFKDLTIAQKKAFYAKKLMFMIYNKGLTNFEKGKLFRNINTTTQVKHQEMLNSYGNIAIANAIRETVRVVQNVNNEINDLFIKEGDNVNSHKFKYLSQSNLQLKQEEFLSKVYYRFWMKFNDKNTKKFLGTCIDEDLVEMFSNATDEEVTKVEKEVKDLLTFLQEMAIAKNTQFSQKLTWKEQVSLTHFYLDMKDTFGKFKINNYEMFFKQYNTCFENVLGKNGDGDVVDLPFEKSGLTIGVNFGNYAKEWSTLAKIEQMLAWLKEDFDFTNNEIFQDLDTQRLFPKTMKNTALTKQGYVCYVDGKDLVYADAEAAHIEAWSLGGRTTVDNIAMVRKEYNKEMGTMNVEEYKLLNGYA